MHEGLKKFQIVSSTFQGDQNDISQFICDFIKIISAVFWTLEMNNKRKQEEVNNHACITVGIIRDFT